MSSWQLLVVLWTPIPIPERPWVHITVDIITDLSASQGNAVILVTVNYVDCSHEETP